MDICQSVLASFFVRTAAGQYDLDSPEQLVKLLVVMTRNKLASAARKQHRQRRDQRKTAGAAEELDRVASREPSPSQIVSGRELLERFRAGLTAEERQIANLRADGLAWSDVAEQLGGQAQARRMQFARAVERVAKELGLDEGGDG
jgi:RNA polymerase sigma-70 factor (ECF subfamily)